MTKITKMLSAMLFMLVSTAIFAQAQQRFVANLSGAQEVPAVATAGRGVCSIVLNAAETQITVSCTYSGLSSAANAGHIHGNAAPGANAGILFNFGTVAGTSGTINQTFAVTAQQVADMRQKKMYVNIHTANNPGGEIRGQIKVFAIDFDADGDARADAFVYRPSNGFGYVQRSTNNTIFAQSLGGQPTDPFQFSADFDGDGISDLGFVRVNPATGQVTSIYTQTSDGAQKQVQWGNVAYGDQPAAGDFDGDGKIDIAVYRQTSGVWYILQSSNNQPRYEYWGQAGGSDLPCVGDYDRDGKADVCVNRVENGQLVWYLRRSSDNQTRRVVFGLSSDGIFPSNPADVDGDGATDILVTRVENGLRVYYALRSSDNSLFVLQWGLGSDNIRIQDMDADGKTDFAALRTINNQIVWFVRQSSDNQTRIIYWGTAGDQ